MSNIQIDWQAFNIRDLNTGKIKCRYCGGIPEPPKRVYCSDECRRRFELALSWPYTRKLALERDNYRCRKCGKIIYAHYINQEGDQLKFINEEELANVHHVIPVAYLWGEIIKALEGCPKHLLDRRREQLKVIVFYHLDNLISLCNKPCHKEEHRSGWYLKFKMMETGQKTLDEMVPE